MKLSTMEIFERLEDAGNVGSMMGQLQSSQIADPVLATLWEDAESVLDQIQQYIEDNQEDVEDDEDLDDND